MSASFEMHKSGRSWTVTRNGARVYGPVSTMFDAETAKDRLERTENHKLRNCMRCSDEFMSEGAHNRMCNPCRAGATDIFDGAV